MDMIKNFLKGRRVATGHEYYKNHDFFEIVKYLLGAEKENKSVKNNTYFIKINTSANCLSDEDFITIVQSFREIAENFCNLFDINTDNLRISILSATPGCININLGININVKEFNIVKISKNKQDLFESIIKYLTNNNIEFYQNNPIQLLKDCITGYITKKIPDDNEKIKYIDIKKSKEARRKILKTIEKQPNTKSVVLDGSYFKVSELDMVV